MKTYIIYCNYQTGNIGSWNLEPIKEQPKTGFTSEDEAETHLINALDTNVIKTSRKYKYLILKTYI